MKTYFNFKAISLFLSILFLWVIEASASLQVYPTRVHFGPKSKTATVAIKLKSDRPEAYRISTMYYQMKPDGSMEQRPELARAKNSAAPYLRFSPKRVLLQPNVEQIVRLSIKNYKNIKGSEVRTHLYFRPDPNNSKQDMNNPGGSKSSFNLKALVAVAIPVVISPGGIKKNFSINDFKVYQSKKGPQFKFDLVNASRGFLYGDIEIYHKKVSKKNLVSATTGVSSYIPVRIVNYPVNSLKAPNLPKGKYILKFKEHSQTSKKNAKVKTLEYMLN